MHRIIAAAGALALLAAASSAGAQQLWETARALPEAYGTYQCGPERVVIDASWQPVGDWDGIHYHVLKNMPDARDIIGHRDFHFSFPIHGGGLDEMFARGGASRYRLTVMSHTGNHYGYGFHEDGTWDCSRQ